MKTLDHRLNKAGNDLEQLIVEMDGMVSVIRLVIPRLLVAARLESWKFKGETDDVGMKVEGTESVEKEESNSDSESAGEQNDDAYSQSGSASSHSANSEHEAGADSQESAGRKSTSLSKIRILELKAEGMAESLASDYPAKLPHDFY